MPDQPKKPRIRKGRLFQEGFWARPPIEQRVVGDATELLIYAAVGYALTAWERTMESLASVFLLLCQANTGETAFAVRRAFGTIENVGGRNAAILAAAESYFGHHWNIPEVRSRVTSLLEEVRCGGFTRNDVAHGIVFGFKQISQDENGKTTERFSGYFLIAPEYMSGRNNQITRDITVDPFSISKSDYRYSASDIKSIGEKFNLLNHEMFKFIEDVGRHPEVNLPNFIFKMLQDDPEGFAMKMRGKG